MYTQCTPNGKFVTMHCTYMLVYELIRVSKIFWINNQHMHTPEIVVICVGSNGEKRIFPRLHSAARVRSFAQFVIRVLGIGETIIIWLTYEISMLFNINVFYYSPRPNIPLNFVVSSICTRNYCCSLRRKLVLQIFQNISKYLWSLFIA